MIEFNANLRRQIVSKYWRDKGMKTVKKHIMFFSPYGSIWPHAVIERQLTKILESKFLVTKVHCDHSFPNVCTIQSNNGISGRSSEIEKQNVCNSCKAKVLNATSTLKSSQVWLPQPIPSVINENVTKLELEFRNHYTEYKYKGIDVGRYALYELILKYKKNTLNLSNEEHLAFLEALSNCIYIVDAANKIIDEIDPHLILVFNPQYGVNSCFSQVAIQKGKKIYYLSGNSAWNEIHRTARIWNYKLYGIQTPVNSNTDLTKIKLSFSEKCGINRQKSILKSAKSPWVYSQPSRNLSAYDFFHIAPDKKIVLAAMNSYDEIFAANIRNPNSILESNEIVFADQIVWIKELILWAQENSKVHLIIRPHPRELPNKREGVTSEFVSEWESEFTNLPSNVSLNHPKDLFSIYDMFSSISILTTGWSSTALEADMFGVPVVTYDSRISKLPIQLGLTGTSREEYFGNLNSIINLGNPKNVGKIGAKWFAQINYRGTFYLPGTLFDRGFLRSLNRYLIFKKIFSLIPVNIVHWLDLRGFVKLSTKKKLIKLIVEELDSIYEL